MIVNQKRDVFLQPEQVDESTRQMPSTKYCDGAARTGIVRQKSPIVFGSARQAATEAPRSLGLAVKQIVQQLGMDRRSDPGNSHQRVFQGVREAVKRSE